MQVTTTVAPSSKSPKRTTSRLHQRFSNCRTPENPRWHATSADRATSQRDVRVGRVPSTWPILLRFCVEDLCRHARQQPHFHGAWFWKYPALARTIRIIPSRPLLHLLTLTSCLFVDESLRTGFFVTFHSYFNLNCNSPLSSTVATLSNSYRLSLQFL